MNRDTQERAQQALRQLNESEKEIQNLLKEKPNAFTAPLCQAILLAIGNLREEGASLLAEKP